jgi:hypothetical protein
MTDIDTNVARRSPPPPTGVGATLGATATQTTPWLPLAADPVLTRSPSKPVRKEPTMFASLIRRTGVLIVTTAGVLTARR